MLQRSVKDLRNSPYLADTLNNRFLASLSFDLFKSIIGDIANNYGCTFNEAHAEVSSYDSEDIMDYVTNNREAVHLLYRKFKRNTG